MRRRRLLRKKAAEVEGQVGEGEPAGEVATDQGGVLPIVWPAIVILLVIIAVVGVVVWRGRRV